MVNLLSIGVGVWLVAMTVLYLRGWLRLRRRGAAFANLPRLFLFGGAVLLTATVFLSPLNWLNQLYFSARVAQYVLLCLFAIPAFFTSCTFDTLVWGLPSHRRRAVGRWMRGQGAVRRMAGTLTRPWLAIVLFIVCFVAWYDSTVAGWLLAESNRHTLSLLVLGGTALLLWWHLIGTGPRLHVELSPWLAAIALLVVELASMSIAVPTTFATEPLYPHYVAAFSAGEQRALHLVDDQALGGGLIWVAGSAVYLSSIVLILNRLFHRHKMDGSKPLAGWDADERMIMPGLEHRVGQKGRSRHRP